MRDKFQVHITDIIELIDKLKMGLDDTEDLEDIDDDFEFDYDDDFED